MRVWSAWFAFPRAAIEPMAATTDLHSRGLRRYIVGP
jgi:hypothetical protein